MKSAPGVSLNMNDDVPKADSLRCLWLSSDIFKVHARNEGTLILPSPPSLLPPRTIARQVNKLFIHVQRGTYDAALQLPCLSRSEVESYTSKKGKACCHSLRWPLRRAGRRSQYIRMFEHKKMRKRVSRILRRITSSDYSCVLPTISQYLTRVGVPSLSSSTLDL